MEWNALYDYDPSQDYDPQEHAYYLSEDLLQLKYEAEELVIDLGWYGEPQEKEGFFQLLLLLTFQRENDLFGPVITHTQIHFC